MTSLPERLTLRDAPAVLGTLGASLQAEAGPVWQIDAGGLKQLDSSALAVLLDLARLATGAQRRLELLNVPPRLHDLARLYGVAELLGIDGGEGEPLRRLQASGGAA